MTEMRAYLDAVVKLHEQLPQKGPYRCFEDFVLQHGQEYVSSPITNEQRGYLLDCVDRYGRRFVKQGCFYNSQLLMLVGDEDRRLTYCEGYGWRHFAVPHGWLLLDGRHVVDTTWRTEKRAGRGRLADCVFGSWKDDRAYFGVTFSRQYVARYVIERAHGGSLIDDPLGHWPLMHGTTPRDAWAA